MENLTAQAALLSGQISKEILAGQDPIILIDGRSGSGKTQFAYLLQGEIFRVTKVKPQLVHMDDLYPGWEGLKAGSNLLVANILKPVSLGSRAHYQIWNWTTSSRGADGEPGNGWREVRPDSPLIVEGCGAISITSRSLANIAIWINSDIQTRTQRLGARDQGSFAAYQGIWIAQEEEFYSQESTISLADISIKN